MVVVHLEPIEGQVDVPWPIFAIAFLITEAFVVHVHFRKEAHTFSMTELALVLGLFMVAPWQLVVAHLVGAVAALAIVRRQRLIKMAFNLALFTLSTGIAVTTFSALAGVRRHGRAAELDRRVGRGHPGGVRRASCSSRS